MDEQWQVEQSEAYRTHLRAVAYRILGDLTETDDAVQESWLRLSRSDTTGPTSQYKISPHSLATTNRERCLTFIVATTTSCPSR